MSTIAILPARGGSVRLPRKNIIEICGRPALSYPLKACVESGLFDHIIISTDDAEIADIARERGATDVYLRPEALSNSKAKVRDVIRYVLSQYKDEHGHVPEIMAIVYPTAVLVTARHLREAFVKLQDNKDIDFTLAVAKMHPHAYKALKKTDQYLRPVFPDKIDLKGQEGGEITAELKTTYANFRAVTGGIINVSGSSKNQDVTIYTGGIVNGEDLKTEQSEVSVNAGGEAYIYASDYVEVRLKAGGNVYIYGNPKEIHQNKVLGGTVKRM